MTIVIDGSKTPEDGWVALGNGISFEFSPALLIDYVGNKVGVGGSLPDAGSYLTIEAGTSSVGSVLFKPGSRLGIPVTGSLEYNGSLLFTREATTGHGYIPSYQHFRLDTDGAAIGPTIADFFGAGSAVQVLSGVLYELTFYCFFTKTTAGTVTFTLTGTQAPASLNGTLQYGAIAGGTATGAANQISIFKSTSATAAFGATGSLTTGVNHAAIIRYIYEGNATPNLTYNIRLRVTSSAGTVTPLQGSYFEVNQLPGSNLGEFV